MLKEIDEYRNIEELNNLKDIERDKKLRKITQVEVAKQVSMWSIGSRVISTPTDVINNEDDIPSSKSPSSFESRIDLLLSGVAEKRQRKQVESTLENRKIEIEQNKLALEQQRLKQMNMVIMTMIKSFQDLVQIIQNQK
jgi:Cu/Ag efflux protein CusF